MHITLEPFDNDLIVLGRRYLWTGRETDLTEGDIWGQAETSIWGQAETIDKRASGVRPRLLTNMAEGIDGLAT